MGFVLIKHDELVPAFKWSARLSEIWHVDSKFLWKSVWVVQDRITAFWIIHDSWDKKRLHYIIYRLSQICTPVFSTAMVFHFISPNVKCAAIRIYKNGLMDLHVRINVLSCLATVSENWQCWISKINYAWQASKTALWQPHLHDNHDESLPQLVFGWITWASWHEQVHISPFHNHLPRARAFWCFSQKTVTNCQGMWWRPACWLCYDNGLWGNLLYWQVFKGQVHTPSAPWLGQEGEMCSDVRGLCPWLPGFCWRAFESRWNCCKYSCRRLDDVWKVLIFPQAQCGEFRFRPQLFLLPLRMGQLTSDRLTTDPRGARLTHIGCFQMTLGAESLALKETKGKGISTPKVLRSMSSFIELTKNNKGGNGLRSIDWTYS